MTIVRKALLIMSPDEGKNSLPGVLVDRTNWRNHLLSAGGGAWDDAEVSVLTNPSAAMVRAFVSLIGNADYTFIAFSGHGAALQDDTTKLHINSAETITSRELVTRAQKQTLVMDCCRIPEEVKRFEAAAGQITMDSIPNRARARRLFDQQLVACAAFRAILNGCAVGQTAGESEQSGGYYTNALIRAAQCAPRNGVMGIREAHIAAKEAVSKRTSTQTPMAELPRSNPTFPFGVGV